MRTGADSAVFYPGLAGSRDRDRVPLLDGHRVGRVTGNSPVNAFEVSVPEDCVGPWSKIDIKGSVVRNV